MKRAAVLAAIIVLCLACFKRERDPSSEKETLAVVGAFYITTADLLRETDASGIQGDPAAASRAFDSLVEEVLVLNSLLNTSEGDPLRPLGDYGDPKKRKDAVSMLLEEKVYSKIEVSSADVREYYDRNIEKFARGKGVLIRQMTLGGGRLKNEAMDLLGPSHSFEDVARLYSISPDRGKPQYFETAELPEYLVPYIMALREGEVSKPIEISKDTYQVIFLEKKADRFVLPLDMVRQMVRLHLSDVKGAALRKDFLDSLGKRYNERLFYERLPFRYVKEN